MAAASDPRAIRPAQAAGTANPGNLSRLEGGKKESFNQYNLKAPKSLPAGTYRVTAFFAGSAHYAPASASATFTISKATPAFGRVFPPVVIRPDGTVLLSGSIAAGALIPTGSVTITINGVSRSGTINPDGTFHVAFPLASLPASKYSIRVDYLGDANFNGISVGGTLDLTALLLRLDD